MIKTLQVYELYTWEQRSYCITVLTKNMKTEQKKKKRTVNRMDEIAKIFIYIKVN